MLIQFNFKNFKSFRDDTSLDLTATKISEYSSHVVTTGGDKILSLAAIYGANASGKSNVYEAFSFMRDYVVNSFSYGGDSTLSQGERLKVTPYLLDVESRNRESEFEVFFVDPKDPRERTYQYGFSIRGTEIIEEWLYTKAKTARNEYRTVFYRKKGEDTEIDGLPKKESDNLIVSLEPETLIVSLGAKLRIDRLKQIRDWFFYHQVLNFEAPANEFFSSSMLPQGFAADRSVQDNVVKYLSSFDESIVGFEVEELRSSEEHMDKIYKINALHRLSGKGGYQSIPLQSESGGTLKMFALYPALKSVFEHGSVMLIDELNARLHPLLVRNIMLSFLTPQINPNHAQLIMTTHDVWQFSNSFLRRDELWVTDKNPDGVSTLYSVADFKDTDGNKIRRSEALAKNYLVGNYGGIPALRPIGIPLEGNKNE